MPAPPPTDDPLLGTVVVGRYRVVRALGAGGMGRVYVAEHTAIRKLIALKVLREEFTQREDIVTRFQQEAISASRIKHPNVVEVFDFGKLQNGSFFLAMELLEGRDLAREIRRVGALEVSTALRVAAQICGALEAAHERGVVHRDMKPENVFLEQAEAGALAVKIVDFGIAQLRDDPKQDAPADDSLRITKAGTILGTPEYMAPEQGAGRGADKRADVYAVGVILYEMFTGRVPFKAHTFVETLAKHQQEAPPPLPTQLSRELRGVVLRALAKRPEDRFQRIAELGRALANTPEGLTAHRPMPRTRSSPPLAPSGRPGGPTERRRPGSLWPPAPRRETLSPSQVARVRSTRPAGKRLVVVSLGLLGALALCFVAVKAFDLVAPPAAERLAAEGRLGSAEGAGGSVLIQLTDGAVRLCNVEVDGVWYGPCEP